MNEKYRDELVAWGVRAAVVVALAVLSALAQRWGVPIHVDPPPAPPVTVVVQPAPGTSAPPTVSVVAPKPE